MAKFEDAARKLTDANTKHDITTATNTYASDAVAYDPMYPQPLRGRDAIKKDMAVYFRGFPDLRFELLTAVGKDGRRGAAEIRMSGAPTGPPASPTRQEIPPTHKRAG